MTCVSTVSRILYTVECKLCSGVLSPVLDKSGNACLEIKDKGLEPLVTGAFFVIGSIVVLEAVTGVVGNDTCVVLRICGGKIGLVLDLVVVNLETYTEVDVGKLINVIISCLTAPGEEYFCRPAACCAVGIVMSLGSVLDLIGG